MDSQSKDTEEEESGDRKKQTTQGEKDRPTQVPSGANFANQESRPRVVEIRPNPETKSSSSAGDQKNSSAGSPSAVGSGGSRPQDGSLPPPKKPKKDRSNLRKGKWTVEEEEYTSRIIHYFGTGLLTLPEGATLRSYLADKLNCDPMRITKKYAGASCLGRRVHQFRDRPTPTVAEIQLAKAELDHLEQRFRMRVEEGYSSMPLNHQPDIMFSLAQQANQFLMNSMGAAPPPPPAAPQNVLPPWLFGLNQQPPAPAAPPAIPPHAAPGLSEQAKVIANLANLGASLPWLLPNAAGSAPLAFPTPQSNTGMPDANTIAGWAFAQAAASLAPAISQLAAVNYQQQQQLQQVPKPAPPVDPMKELSARLKETRDAESLRQALQAAMASAPLAASQPPSNMSSSQAGPAPGASRQLQMHTTGQPISQVPSAQQQVKQPAGPPPVPAVAAPAVSTSPPQPPQPNPSVVETGTAKRSRTIEEHQAGDILLGFLSSLRQSYEEAVKEKEEASDSAPQQKKNEGAPRPTVSLQDALVNNAQRRGVSIVSDLSSGVSSSTGQPESSIEESDWNSDKKTETSSSEDSDKEVNGSSSKGPPRKRLKTKRAADERQRESRN